MRVASISKSFTAAAMARLWEDGKLDLDRPVQDYVPEFPEKHFEGSKVSLLKSHCLTFIFVCNFFWFGSRFVLP